MGKKLMPFSFLHSSLTKTHIVLYFIDIMPNKLFNFSIFIKILFICTLLYSSMKCIQTTPIISSIPKDHFFVNAKPTGLAYIDDLDNKLMPHRNALNFVGVVFMEFDEEQLINGNLRFNNIFTFDNVTNVCKLLVKSNSNKIITDEELQEKYLTNETKRLLLDAVNGICVEHEELNEMLNDNFLFGMSENTVWAVIFMLNACFVLFTIHDDVMIVKAMHDVEKGEKLD